MLPVEPGEERKFGDGMKTMAEIGAHNRYDLIVVAPFAEVPWFGNHASDPRRRQEDYLMKTVVPLIEEHYSALGTAEGRSCSGSVNRLGADADSEKSGLLRLCGQLGCPDVY